MTIEFIFQIDKNLFIIIKLILEKTIDRLDIYIYIYTLHTHICINRYSNYNYRNIFYIFYKMQWL